MKKDNTETKLPNLKAIYPLLIENMPSALNISDSSKV